MITLVTFCFRTNLGHTVPWEGELPAVGDRLLDLEVNIKGVSVGPEQPGFNNSVPEFTKFHLNGVVTERHWMGPGRVIIVYDHEE